MTDINYPNQEQYSRPEAVSIERLRSEHLQRALVMANSSASNILEPIKVEPIYAPPIDKIDQSAEVSAAQDQVRSALDLPINELNGTQNQEDYDLVA